MSFLDTAGMYGPRREQLIGVAIAGMRDAVFLAGKFGILRDPANPARRGGMVAPESIRVSVNGALAAGVDTLDLPCRHHGP